jgi:hypothetical protein
MKTENILMLDYREEESKEIIQKVLRKIKPLSKYSEEEQIPLEAIEKLIRVLSQKYEIMPQWMSMSLHETAVNVYSIGIKTTTDHRWLGTVYGICLYEIFAKLAIKMYSEIKQGNVGPRVKTEEEKERELLAKKVKETKEGS